MKRLEFIVLLASALVACQLVAFAQERPELPRIIVIGQLIPADQMRAFEEGLQSLGHIKGSTISIEYRSAQGREDKLAELAQEAAALKPKVIAAIGTKAALAAKRATTDIPIVAVTGDITAAGVVKNLARPESNITGLSFFFIDLQQKRLGILLELAPRLRRISVLTSGRHPPHRQQALTILATAAKAKGIDVRVITVDRVGDAGSVIAKLPSSAEEGLLVMSAVDLDAHAAEIGQLTAEHRLIAMLPWRQYVEAGGLVSYAPDIIAIWRRASSYVDRILRGASPSDLPIEQPTEFELVINLRMAEALGLTVPATLLLRADKVIE